MSQTPEITPPGQGGEATGSADLGSRLTFFKNLQIVTNRIHATSNIEEIILELSQDICALFHADRLTVYTTSADRNAIVSKVKTGLNSFKDIRLPVSDRSIAGYVALLRQTVNIRDVYDEAELRSVGENLRFLQDIDRRTHYRTQQMLVSPIVDNRTGDLLGVVQIINHKAGIPFVGFQEEGIKSLCETLAIAFTQRSQPERVARRKYDYLTLDNVISASEMDLAGKTARSKGIDIEEVLLTDTLVKPATIGASLAKFFGVPYEPFKADRIKPVELMKNLRREYVELNQWLPIEDSKDGIVVLTLDPEQLKGSRVVSTIFPKSKVVYRVTTKREFNQTVDQFFDASGIDMGDYESVDAEDIDDEVSAAADNEVVKLVNKIIVDAYNQGASDIHIEPGRGKDRILVRLRRDGALQKYIEIPHELRSSVIARIKIMCDLDISEKRKPQDGKIQFKKFGPLDIELRVATLPTSGGVEDVVMRILAAGEPIPLEKLGLLPQTEKTLVATVSKPYGMFMVCGPTGSGKTTTLHSVLKLLNTVDTKIWTVEDPVEITQKGLRQVQINRKAGIDFATVMRAFLRADPDIIMVGEMRDAETTRIGIEASLTGHLVLGTLHTNSAPESIVRLLDMGMDPFNFSDALLGILAQRLAKRLCSKCRQAYIPDTAEIKLFMTEYCEELMHTSAFKTDVKVASETIYKFWLKQYANDKGQLTFYRAQEGGNCDTCGGSGYKGRVGLHELMVGSDALKKLIQEHARVAQLLAQALEDGMRTLKQDGMEKMLMGLTDLKQVRAVCIK
jgi:type II secretory ATPase GspE/PulE/Tfp pilus assembly ATPase PilB-like protein